MQCRVWKSRKKLRKTVFFWDNIIWIGIVKFSLLRRLYFSSAGIVLTISPKVLHVNKRDFSQLSWIGSDQWRWSMSMIKVLWCRFQKCLCTFTMLLVERSSEARLFRHLSNHIFGVQNIGIIKALMVVFCFKIF